MHGLVPLTYAPGNATNGCNEEQDSIYKKRETPLDEIRVDEPMGDHAIGHSLC